VIIIFTLLLLLYSTVEVSMVYIVRPAYNRGDKRSVLVIGLCAFVLSICGYLQILIELLKSRGRVVGISFFFIGVDMVGALLSLLSLLVQDEFDTLFGTL
jgi:hypothetical protein